MNSTYDFLFIGQGELSFILNSLKNLLDKAGLRTEKCSIDMKELGAVNDWPEIFVVEAAALINNPDSRVFLYDLCLGKNRKIALIGETDELGDLKSLTASSVFIGIYERPINNNEVAKNLENKLDQLKDKNNRKSILVIDDSPTFLRLINEWLDEDYCVEICPSATAAFHKIEVRKPNLILLDYEMPVCNGAQFLGMLRSEAELSDIPVVFLTSRDDAATVKEILPLKPQGYLLKTQTKEMVLKFIDEFFKKEMAKGR